MSLNAVFIGSLAFTVKRRAVKGLSAVLLIKKIPYKVKD